MVNPPPTHCIISHVVSIQQYNTSFGYGSTIQNIHGYIVYRALQKDELSVYSSVGCVVQTNRLVLQIVIFSYCKNYGLRTPTFGYCKVINGITSYSCVIVIVFGPTEITQFAQHSPFVSRLLGRQFTRAVRVKVIQGDRTSSQQITTEALTNLSTYHLVICSR